MKLDGAYLALIVAVIIMIFIAVFVMGRTIWG